MMSFSEIIALSNSELTKLFLAILLLLISSSFFGYIFSKLKLPKVIGEISGGLIVGPYFLGFFFPNTFNLIFNAFESEGKIISFIYWLGLILLMFISGFEMQRFLDKEDRKLITAIVIGATVIPFIAGWLAPSFYDFSPFIGQKNNLIALKIVIAIAVAVTSIPVISKIFLDLNIINTRFAKIILAAATLQDILLWIALTIATSLVSSQVTSISEILFSVAITLIFFIISLLFIPKLISFLNNLEINFLIKSSVPGYSLLICFIFVVLSNVLNINIVFGAFLSGIVIGNLKEEKFIKAKENIKEISLAIFIPIYFAVVGMKLNLINSLNISFLFGFLLFTAFFELLGTIIAARLVKIDWFSSFNLGVAMNARGGPGIVLATIAFDLGIINEIFFVTLVLIAIITSLIAGCWFKFVLSNKWELLK